MADQVIPIFWSGNEKEIIVDKNLTTRGENLTVLLLLLGRNDSSVNVKITIRHQAPDTSSRIILKGALNDQSKVDFDGLVKIDKGAKNSNAWLEARLLLLSDRSTGRAVPNLEIAENAVKAGHATSVGRVSDLELFYLMSRGLSQDQSTHLIVQGFLRDLLLKFPQAKQAKIDKQLAWTI